jgi:hypothetical protein
VKRGSFKRTFVHLKTKPPRLRKTEMETDKMDTNVVRFPFGVWSLLTDRETARIRDLRSWTPEKNGRRSIAIRGGTFRLWQGPRGGWNWRIDYVTGERIAQRGYLTEDGAISCGLIWVDCLHRLDMQKQTAA